MVAALLDLDEGAGAAFKPLDQMAGCFLHRHNVSDKNLSLGMVGGICQFFGIADYSVDFGHTGKRVGIYLSGAASHNYLRAGPLATCLANRLARLAFGFLCDSTGVEDDRIIQSGSTASNNLGLESVEAAAEGDDVWCAVHAAPVAIFKVPVKATATGPLITT